MRSIWNTIKTLHYKWRYEALVEEMYLEACENGCELTIDAWKQLNCLITWQQRKQDLIDKGIIYGTKTNKKNAV